MGDADGESAEAAALRAECDRLSCPLMSERVGDQTAEAAHVQEETLSK